MSSSKNRRRTNNQKENTMQPVSTNPFETPEAEASQTATGAEDTNQGGDIAGTEVAEVDTPEALPDEDTEEVATDATAAATEDKPKAEKKPARPKPPEGYITPVEFAKKLTAHLAEKGASNKNGPIGRDSEGNINLTLNPIPPQYIYSMINNGRKPNAKNPLPTYSEGGRENLLKLDEALAWWDAKDSRVAASRAAAAEKKAKAAAKAQTSTQAAEETGEVATGPVTEVE